jgi:hypothetical protein
LKNEAAASLIQGWVSASLSLLQLSYVIAIIVRNLDYSVALRSVFCPIGNPKLHNVQLIASLQQFRFISTSVLSHIFHTHEPKWFEVV